MILFILYILIAISIIGICITIASYGVFNSENKTDYKMQLVGIVITAIGMGLSLLYEVLSDIISPNIVI